VLLGREGNPDLSAAAEATLVWTDISSYAKGIQVDIGDQNEIPLGSTAGAGKASFKLLNNNPLGLFSPGHASVLSGFDLANPVRIRTYDGTTTRPLFRGFISDINPVTGPRGERMTAIDCVDWMEVPAVSPIGNVEVVLDQLSDFCIRRLFDQLNRPPAAVDIDTGSELFPFAFDQVDGISGRVLREVAEIVRCEGGQCYVQRDGTVRVEARTRRQIGSTTPAIVLSGDWQELEVGQGLHQIINIQRATVYPREAGSVTTTVLTGTTTSGSTARRQRLVPDVNTPIEGSYVDPTEKATNVGAIDIQTITATTDYTMTANEDGTGTDLTSYVEFVSGNPPQGGSSYSVVVRNTHPFLEGWFHMQIRGRILRRFDPKGTYFDDPDSVNRYLPREPPTIDLRYLSSVEAGMGRCAFMVNSFKSPKSRPRLMRLVLNPTIAITSDFLDLELGDLVQLTEPVSGLTDEGYWIQAMHFSLEEHNICTIVLRLVPLTATGPVFIVGDAEFGVVGTAIVGY
jgi:hypothetical protein